MADLSANRLLKIKSDVINRLFKDVDEYRKEIESLENRNSELVAAGEDPGEWALKNNSRMIVESKKMVDDTMKRLEKAADALETVIAKVKETGSGMSEDELLKAEKILQKVKGTGNENEGENVKAEVKETAVG